MTREEATKLMESSKTEQEWNDNCDKVKKAFNGYPDFWFQDIQLSGLMRKTINAFKAGAPS
jgi:hypothetical protein